MRFVRFIIAPLILLFPLGFLLIGAVGFVRGLWNFLNTEERLAVVVSQEATRALGRDVRVEGVKFTGDLWSLAAVNQVELNNISVAEGLEPTSGFFASAEKVTLHYSLRQLAFSVDPRLPYVSDVHLTRPRLSLRRDTQGRWNFEELFKPTTAAGRPFLGKLSLTDGTLFYADQVFPHPSNVPARPLITRLERVSGAAALRSDSSVTFDVTGTGEPRIGQDFHAIGAFTPKPLHISAYLEADKTRLPFLSERFLSPDDARITAGTANLKLSLLYQGTDEKLLPTPNPQPPTPTWDWRADLEQATGVAAEGRILGATARNVSGSASIADDSFSGNLRGLYAGTEVRLNGAILWSNAPPNRAQSQPPVFSVEGFAPNADIARIARALPAAQLAKLTPEGRNRLRRARGRGSLELHAAGTFENPVATLTARLPSVQVDGYRAENLAVKAEYANRTLRADAQGQYAGGEVMLRGRLQNDKTSAYEVEARGRQIALARLPIPADWKAKGVVNLDMALRGQKGGQPQASAQVRLTEARINNKTLQSVYVRAELAGNEVRLRRFRINDRKGSVLARGLIDLKSRQINVNLEADELDIGALVEAFRKPSTSLPLSYAPDAEPKLLREGGDLLDSPLLAPDSDVVTGVGFFRGKIVGALRQPRLLGKATGVAVQAQGIAFDSIVANLDISRDALLINEGKAQRILGKMFFTGGVAQPFDDEPTIHLTFRADSLDVTDLLQLAGWNQWQYMLTGTLSTDTLRIEGSPGALVVQPFTARLENGAINGQPIREARLTAEYGGRGLSIVDAQAQIAGGSLAASGGMGTDGQLDLQIRASNLDLDTLGVILPESLAVQVDGSLSLDAAVKGALEAPEATVTANVQDFTLNTFHLGELRGAAKLEGKIVTLSDVALDLRSDSPDDKLVVPQLTYNLESKAVRGEAVWERVRLQQLRELFQAGLNSGSESDRATLETLQRITGPIEGLLSGKIALSGTSEDPQADLSWEARDIRAGNYPPLTLTGSANANKQRVFVPMAKLESKEANLEVVANKINIEYEGNISGDIGAYNVDLTLLHNWAAQNGSDPAQPADPRRLTGVGDIGIVASGKTKSPELEVSINLRDVAYMDPARLRPSGQTAELTEAERNRLAQQTIDHIDLYGATIKEGRIEGNLRVLKQGVVNQKSVEIDLAVNGSVGFTWTPPFIPEDAALNIQTGQPNRPEWNLPLDAITLLARTAYLTMNPTAKGLADPFSRTEGTLGLSASVTGTRKNPKVSGALTVQAPKVQILDLNTGLKDVSGTLRLEGDRLTVAEGFQAQVQVYKDGKEDPSRPSAPLTLAGSLPLGFGAQANTPPGPGLSLRAERVAFLESPLPGATTGSASGIGELALNVTGSVKEPTLSGDITLHDSAMTLPGDFGGAAQNIAALPIDPRFDLHLRLGQNVRLTNSQMNVRLEGPVDLTGRLADPRLRGDLTIAEGRLVLPTTQRFTILPPGQLSLRYPIYHGARNDPELDININLRAQTFLTATSTYGVQKQYRVTVAARGPLTTEDPAEEGARLTLNFQSDPPDLAINQQALNQRLSTILGGGDIVNQFGRNPAQALAQQMSRMFTSSLFDRLAAAGGFEALSIGYDPIRRSSILTVSRQIVGPLFLSYYRNLSGAVNTFNFRASLRFRNRYQVSFETNEQQDRRLLLEGFWRF